MSTEKGTVTVEDLFALKGKEHPPVVCAPVSASDIRKFAIAAYWPETPPRLFWDEEYARETKWGRIIAPQEFNPFAWPVAGPGRLPVEADVVAGARNFNAGTEVEYGVPMRPGDVITATQRVAEVYERRGRTGRLIFVVSETVWRNQRGELVKTLRSSNVQVLTEGEGR